MEKIERQELWCHNCRHYVQFDMDLSINGNHVLTCPVCGHEHCRVVKDGIITEDRWDRRNNTVYISSSTVSYSILSVDSTSTSTNDYCRELWFCTSTVAG